MDSNATEQQDEVESFLDARYVSAVKVRWRIFSFSMHKEFPSCQRLDIHLLGDRLIYYNENDHLSAVMRRPISESTLTAWFKYNANNLDDEDTRDITYPDFCEKCIFHVESRPRFWSPRRAGFRGTIGLMYTVSSRNIEKYQLRLLLLQVPNAKSFENLRTVNGQVYNLFHAALTQSSSSLKKLFCVLVAFSGISNTYQLWLDYKASMTDDYLYKYQRN
jgi:hypothetical protein